MNVHVFIYLFYLPCTEKNIYFSNNYLYYLFQGYIILKPVVQSTRASLPTWSDCLPASQVFAQESALTTSLDSGPVLGVNNYRLKGILFAPKTLLLRA